MNRSETIKAHKLSQGMVDALTGAAFREHATGNGEAGYVIHEVHPRTRKALHDRGLMYGHYYLTRKGIEALAALAGNVVDITGYVWEGDKLLVAPYVETYAEDVKAENVTVTDMPSAPEFDAPGASECYFGCGSPVVAVFVDYVGRTEGLCASHRDRVEGQTYDVPATSQTDAESVCTATDDNPDCLHCERVAMDTVDMRESVQELNRATEESSMNTQTVATVNVVQAHMGMNGMNHYHAPGCRDIQREARRHGAVKGAGIYEFPFSSVAAIIEHEYSDCNNGDAHDMVSHANDDFDGLKIMSCLLDSLPLGEIQGYPLKWEGGRWTLGDMPLDDKRCDVCEVFGNVAPNSVDIDGKHVCGYCVDNGRSLENLNSHALVFYVETEKAGTKYECTNCRSIDTRVNFAEWQCEGDESPIHNAFKDDDTDAGFVETDSVEDVSLSTVSTGTTLHTLDSAGKAWISFQHVLSAGDVVKVVGMQGVYEVHCTIPGLPTVYVLPTQGAPFPVDASKVYAL